MLNCLAFNGEHRRLTIANPQELIAWWKGHEKKSLGGKEEEQTFVGKLTKAKLIALKSCFVMEMNSELKRNQGEIRREALRATLLMKYGDVLSKR